MIYNFLYINNFLLLYIYFLKVEFKICDLQKIKIKAASINYSKIAN